LRTAPGIEITIALQGQAMLLDAHVTHPHLFNEFVHRHPARPLERIQDFQPLGATDLYEQSLVHVREKTSARLYPI
jgi:hypothetical protein